jgi:hypothetical protein
VPTAEEIGAGQQRHHRLGEQEHHQDVDQRGQAQREREALHVTDREVVQQRRGEERDGVRDQDRAPGPLPAAFHRGAQRPALPDLVAQPLEEHHERVGGDADRDDQAGHARERKREPGVPGQHDHGQPGEQRGDREAEHRHHGQAAIVDERVDHDEQQPDHPRDQPGAQLRGAQLR